MSQPPINPLKNMKIDYWYKALTVVGAALFVFNGTSFLTDIPLFHWFFCPPASFLLVWGSGLITLSK